ncbi:MAG: hypothetical protein IPI49_25705 [Myxococcales bacterium]|nr:hypothetical protein [Myxococcales bacterium]
MFLAPPLCKEEEDALTLATINYALIVINGKAQDSDLVWLAAYALYHYTCLNGPQQVYQLLKVILPAVNLALPRPPIAGGNPIAPLRPPPPIPPKAPAPLPNPNPAPAPEVAPAPRQVLTVPASPLDLSIARAHQNILTAPGLNNAVRKMSLCNATGAINRSVDLLFTVQCSNFFNPPPAGFEEVITVTPTLAAKGQAGDCVALFEQIEPRFASPPNQNCIVTRVAMQTPLAVNLYKITRAGDTFTLAHAAN